MIESTIWICSHRLEMSLCLVLSDRDMSRLVVSVTELVRRVEEGFRGGWCAFSRSFDSFICHW
jgi:hypothetical protein